MTELTYESTVADFLEATRSSIVRLCEASDSLPHADHVKRLSQSIVAKIGFDVDEREYLNTRYAFELLRGLFVRVPQPVRYFRDAVDGVEVGYFLMEYIQGQRLEDCELSTKIMDKVIKAFEIMLTTKDLRHVSLPGPVSGGFAAGFPWGHRPVEQVFHDLRDVEKCLNKRINSTSSPLGAMTFHDQDCVLTHVDPAPRNIIIPDGKDIEFVAFIDWSDCCLYPPSVGIGAFYNIASSVAAEQRPLYDSMITKLSHSLGVAMKDIERLERAHIESGRRYFGDVAGL